MSYTDDSIGGDIMDMHLMHERFVDESIQFRKMGEELVIIDVQNEHASASISLQGAQVLSWTPADQMPVIWLSDQADYQKGKSIRGGAPICWPWFGAHENDNSQPAHGFVRTQVWNLTSVQTLPDGQTELTFSCELTKGISKQFDQCELTFYVRVGKRLEMYLETRNKGSHSIKLTEALHTYFRVSDIRQVSIKGLEDCRYLDKLENFSEKIQSGKITIDAEIDRVYLDTTKDCIIEDPGLQRKIVISKSGSESTVVWNPWSHKTLQMSDMEELGYLDMLCVETANAAENTVKVDAGEKHVMEIVYRVEDL